MKKRKREVLDSLARIGKQWDLEESAMRVWGCMLLKYICLLLLILQKEDHDNKIRVEEFQGI